MNDARLDALMSGRFDTLTRIAGLWRIPGFSLAIIREADAATYAWGLRDAGRRLPMTESTRVPLGSLSKSLIAAVAAQRVAEQVTGWDRAQEPSFLPASHQGVTLAHLLSHSSGMPSYNLLLHYSADETRAALLERLRHLAGAHAPGTAYLYSNTMFIAACGLLESLTAVPWERQYHDLLRAIGIAGHMIDAEGVEKASPHGWAEEQGAFVVEEIEPVPATAHPLAGLICDIREMVAFMRLHLFGTGESGRLLGEGDLAELRRSRIRMPEIGYPAGATSTGYGLGWVLGRAGEHEMLIHAGSVGNMRAMTALLPDSGVGVSLLCNGDAEHSPVHPECCFMCAVVFRVIDWLCATKLALPDEPVPPPVRRADAAPLPRAVRAAAEPDLAGSYSHPGFGTLTVAPSDGGHLRLRYGRYSGLLARGPAGAISAVPDGRDGPVVPVQRGGRSLLARMEPSVPSFPFARVRRG
ncbi:serine hydrolase domain-containing protein [Nonomuraea zeae]|uniref:Beta-lactamase family protein n=1 Tax=Nonomuraea zeae TaxID=1642303 RepID=A0A5S4FMQ5_9ACTN|nr:serine hydrolase domain-containing protein [Nonomuraea zeae]TMR21953.1 beta-lactamase family protein [Nonomuraea zeae]